MDFIVKFAGSSKELKRLILYITVSGAFFIVFSCFYVIPYGDDLDSQIYVVNSFLDQRNKLSYLLNRERQKTGQLECRSWTRSTSSSGGWCKTDSKPTSSQHKTDLKLAKQLSKYLKGKRVGSFGDGPGLYKKYFDDTNMLEVYEAYDGAPFAESVSSGRVKFLDLSIPQYGRPIYDWIISLEVAEHISPKHEKTFLSNLVRHAKTGIILSWAWPGQGGYSHVNEQNLTYVIDVMKNFGFERNLKDSQMLQSNCDWYWLKDNVNVYFRKLNYPIDFNDA